jgi:hypothetical protein
MFRGSKPVTVEVEFDEYQAPYARERSYHPTQKKTELKGGGSRLKFQTTEEALEQVCRWVMSYGNHGARSETRSAKRDDT